MSNSNPSLDVDDQNILRPQAKGETCHSIMSILYGEYFVEIKTCSLAANFANHKSYLFYTPKVSFKQILEKIKSSNPNFFPDQVFIATRFFERLFQFNIGGSVAQIVKQSNEDRSALQQTYRLKSAFEIEKGPSLCSDQMIFPIDDDFSSSQLTADIKKKGARRAVLLLNKVEITSQKFEEVQRALQSEGLECFPRSYAELTDELQTKNKLDACLWGRFLEFQEEIKNGFELQGFQPKIFFLTNNGEPLQNLQHPTHLLYGFESCLGDYCRKKSIGQSLELCTEKFYFHSPLKTQNVLTNLIGSFLLPHTHRQDLSLQPSQAIELDEFAEVALSKISYGFDPGPLHFGRGQRMLSLDLFFKENVCPEYIEFIPASAAKKFLMQMQSLHKNSTQNEKNLEQFILSIKKLISLRLKHIALTTSFDEKTLIFGLGSNWFANEWQEWQQAGILKKAIFDPKLNHTDLILQKVFS